jgi:hypothetical protein
MKHLKQQKGRLDNQVQKIKIMKKRGKSKSSIYTLWNEMPVLGAILDKKLFEVFIKWLLSF